ncbi:Nucleolar complex protein 3 [Grifola frondosa]|uniref:Nucleolar complex-associated protein 3 n=1 Tax=Grifola frondosa TaxID=5627 RepID=A0A1C7MEH4_GRIFR|nr:Nucleolar complex protein 3 [Grifola frondosa]
MALRLEENTVRKGTDVNLSKAQVREWFNASVTVTVFTIERKSRDLHNASFDRVATKKRAAQPAQGPSKRRKITSQKGRGDHAKATKTKAKGKEKASDRLIIPIPTQGDDDVELSENDLEVLEEFGSAATFLNRLDEKGIARSKKETDRLYQMHKPVRKAVEDDLPSIDSHDEDEESWDSEIGEDEEEDADSQIWDSDGEASSSASTSAPRKHRQKLDLDGEMPYETLPRKRRPSWEPESDKEKGIERLPIKLADGRIQKSGSKVFLDDEEESGLESDDDDADREAVEEQPRLREDVSTGARFGRPAVVDVIGNKSRKARLQGAKEQIAGLCQEILGDPENSLGLLRRLHTFSLPEISTPSHPEPVLNDVLVRRLTMLSQLAVFKDIIPGYRIRALTEKEKAEKVSQMVQRTRDWEQGLVGVYQSYLRSLEAEVKGTVYCAVPLKRTSMLTRSGVVTAKSELAETALHCMCTLLVEVTHFNFRVNLMTSVVAALSRKSWNKTSDLCLNCLIKVLRADNAGEASLEVVRLLNRMIKERKFNVHPEVLSCLLHLRLKTELGVRASESKADREDSGKAFSKGRAAARRAKGKTVDQPHLSKKAKKTLKERKEIEKEMHEAAAEVDKEERAVMQTETLKLLFVLYFRILKNPRPTPLLPAALKGISKFSHLVNIDFFKDLMQGTATETSHDASEIAMVQHQLLCIVTAFELLSGQGEALDIDLSDFINRLYAIIPTLSLLPDIEAPPREAFASDLRSPKAQSTSDILFRALHLRLPPPWRSAAFAKRLLAASLQWPSATAVRALQLVHELLERDPKLEALLSTEERSGNGVYRADLDDPQLSNPFEASFWELHVLARAHWDRGVREEAGKLLNFSP